MTSEILTPAVLEWAGRAAPGARVARCAVRPMAGGAVARRVDQVTLHARYHGAKGLPAVIPRVTPAWWQALCREWVDPPLREHAARHPPETTARARALVSRAAGDPAASALLAGWPPTLLHGDVHPGNVVVHADRATLIDWGTGGPRCRSPFSTCPGRPPTCPPAMSSPHWTRSSGHSASCDR